MRVVIVEDHPLYLEALCTHIARAVDTAEIAAASSITEAEALLSAEPADLILLDYALPDASGLDALRRILAVADRVPVIVMSGVANDREVTACIQAGARGFLPKTLDGQLISMAVSLVANGGTYVPAGIMAGLTSTACAGGPRGRDEAADTCAAEFSTREVTILQMLVAGNSNKEIARTLDVEEVTVKFYLTRLFRRMGVKNRSQAAVDALQRGIVEPRLSRG